jgi:hypothetical protein
MLGRPGTWVPGLSRQTWPCVLSSTEGPMSGHARCPTVLFACCVTALSLRFCSFQLQCHRHDHHRIRHWDTPTFLAIASSVLAPHCHRCDSERRPNAVLRRHRSRCGALRFSWYHHHIIYIAETYHSWLVIEAPWLVNGGHGASLMMFATAIDRSHTRKFCSGAPASARASCRYSSFLIASAPPMFLRTGLLT